jgi:hypothetical protein
VKAPIASARPISLKVLRRVDCIEDSCGGSWVCSAQRCGSARSVEAGVPSCHHRKVNDFNDRGWAFADATVMFA